MFSATACSDPGIVWVNKKTDDGDPEGQLSSLNNTMECGRCNVDRPRTATHCYECGLCVDQLDHHCPVSHGSWGE
jgi:succinate dehydrogenase/fumarate reductase flavoprotein subunit